MGRWSSKVSLLIAILSITTGCAARKPKPPTAGLFEIDVPIPCLTQPVRLLDCNLSTGKCQQAVVTRRRDCEQIKVNR
jgi:hypothetical protein